MEFTLLWAAVTGVVLAWVFIRSTPAVGKVVDDPFGALIGATVVGVGVGRLGAMALSGTNPLTHPGDILLIRGGVDTGLASLGALAALVWMSRVDLFATLDALTAPALAGLAGWHFGCVWRGSCLGTATDMPWAITAEGSSIGRHPTELYAAVLMLGVAWLSRRRWMKGAMPPALIAASGLTAASLIRLITEPLRLSLGAGATGWYALGSLIGSGAVAVAFFARSGRLGRSGPAPD